MTAHFRRGWDLPYKNHFSKRLTCLLDERGWTEVKAASVLGVSSTMMYKYVKGQNFPVVEFFATMADVFDVSTDWLLGRTNNRFAHRCASEGKGNTEEKER